MPPSNQKRSETPAQVPLEAGSITPLPNAADLDEIESFVKLGRWEWNVATGALACSQQLLHIYGVASQDMMPSATSFLLRTHQADRTRARASMMRALQTHAPFQFQQRIVRLDNGEVRVLRTRGTVELDANGKPVRIRGFSQDVTELHAADQRAQETLKRAARRTLDREEQDRSQIALRIREDVTAPLLALGRKLASGAAPPDADATSSIEECISIANTVGTNTLRIIGSLQPALLEEQGLLAALRSEALRIGRIAAVPVSISGDEISPRLPPGVESALFRVAQEALLNASRHSGCTLISVSLTESSGHIRLEVQDNGCGIDENMPPPVGAGTEEKRGLTLMRERAEAISATFRLSSKPGAGTRVTVDYRA